MLKVEKTLNIFCSVFCKVTCNTKKKTATGVHLWFEGALLSCCFQINRKTQVPRHSCRGEFSEKFFFPFGVHTCDSRGGGGDGDGDVGVKLVKRMAEQLRQQMDNKGDDGGLSVRPVLPFILVISPVQHGRGRSGTPHKGFSITLREHLFPKPFMFICTSAA